ncbi:riboflavin aldehyde-forming enzyme [Stachybotrys elegans]|uniref:Riboflavin aldehyde-forming enzyme n=1 Tax=Stachybotrys elegans TaxID=80388 RepID=A0A8K0WQY3_9HYPO|nr:riboflavin aldehyde-forming enzyme [Stachybotrys elegans]
MVSFKTIFAILPFALAAPTLQHAGEITYFDPGLGACGQTHSGADFIAAVSHIRYDRENLCGRRLRVSYQGRSADVQIVDRCAGCAENDVDLSPSAFQAAVGDLGLGRVQGTWEFI